MNNNDYYVNRAEYVRKVGREQINLIQTRVDIEVQDVLNSYLQHLELSKGNATFEYSWAGKNLGYVKWMISPKCKNAEAMALICPHIDEYFLAVDPRLGGYLFTCENRGWGTPVVVRIDGSKLEWERDDVAGPRKVTKFMGSR